MKSNRSLRDLWDPNKHSNIHTRQVPEGEEKEKEAERIFEEITAENLISKTLIYKLKKLKELHIEYKLKEIQPTHIIIKLSKDKTRLLKAEREKQFIM